MWCFESLEITRIRKELLKFYSLEQSITRASVAQSTKYSETFIAFTLYPFTIHKSEENKLAMMRIYFTVNPCTYLAPK